MCCIQNSRSANPSCTTRKKLKKYFHFNFYNHFSFYIDLGLSSSEYSPRPQILKVFSDDRPPAVEIAHQTKLGYGNAIGNDNKPRALIRITDRNALTFYCHNFYNCCFAQDEYASIMPGFFFLIAENFFFFFRTNAR